MLSENVNFNIVLPGGCSSNCEFCTWDKSANDNKRFIAKIFNTLSKLPETFKYITILGGEPTESSYLRNLLVLLAGRFEDRFERVVLTTNGSKLDEFLDVIGVVDHINISRHHYYSVENNNIFGKKLQNKYQMQRLCKSLNKLGVDVTYNCVVREDVHHGDYAHFVKFAKFTGASSICFKKDVRENTLVESNTELSIMNDGYSRVSTSSCPTCTTNGYIVDGMYIYCTSALENGFIENGETIENVIFHADGEITMDWDKKHKFEIK